MQVGESLNYRAYTLNIGVKAADEKGGDSTLANDIKEGKIDAKSISNSYLFEFSLKVEQFSFGSIAIQGGGFDIEKVREKVKKLTEGLDLGSLGYSGRPIYELSPDEAKELVSEDGIFGVKQTSERVAQFVLSGGGDDVERLKAGREGIIRGFKEAEKLWGEKLPDISYETLDKSLAKIDEKIESLGGKALDTKA